MSRVGLICVLLVALSTTPAAVTSQTGAPALLHRVFLTSGDALPIYGEPAYVDGRVIFVLVAGERGGRPIFQLMSVPVVRVDLERTERYTAAVRAAQYAATRGEDEFVAMSNEVARALDQLAGVADRRKRLDLAIEARRRLLTWSGDHVSYRAADIHDLAALFDDVIQEMRAAIGDPTLSFDLVSAPSPSREPLQPTPTSDQSVTLALVAADAADVVEDRIAVLSAAASAGGLVSEIAKTRLDAELRVSAAYAALAGGLRERANRARRQADTAGISRASRDLEKADRDLGYRRPIEMQVLRRELDTMLESTRAYRLARATYSRQRQSLVAYNRQVRPLLTRVGRLQSVLANIRETIDVGRARARRTATDLRDVQSDLQRLRPPASLVAVHEIFSGALHMAVEACERRAAVAELAGPPARDAAAAAAGALLLVNQARLGLAKGLRPPAIR